MASSSKKSEVSIPGQDFSNDELASLKSFDDALALLKEKLGGESAIGVADQELGDGFKLLEDKDNLIGVGMILVKWDFTTGDFGEFVSIKLMTESGEKYIVNDGSTRIRDQLMEYSAKKNTQAGLFVKNGFRRSDYEYTDESGKKTPAKTYYLDTSA